MNERLGAERYGTFGLLAKRAMDVLVSLVLLVVLSPLLLMIAAAVRLTSPGPALFHQTRIGFRETTFTILKFRTMAVGSSESAHRELVQSMLRDETSAEERLSDDPDAVFKLVDDPRVTKLGKWLRQTSLDELPQLWNVLRGEMSLVGPRPCLVYEVSDFSPDHRLRARSWPGMTGLWQVTGRNQLHMREALDLDLTYVQTCSLRTDLVILAKTVGVVARGSGF